MKKNDDGRLFTAFRLDMWQAKALDALAKEDMRSRNMLMRILINDYVKTRLTPEQINEFKARWGAGDVNTFER